MERPWALLAIGLLVVLVGTPVLVFAALGPGDPPRSTAGAGAAESRAKSPAASATAAAKSPGGSPGASPTPPAMPGGDTAAPGAGEATVETRMPIVPVVRFWSTRRSISMAELRAALEGRSRRFREVVLSPVDRDAIAAAAGVTPARSVRSATPATVRAAVRRGALGLLRASEVTPAVRALALEGRHLFGTERVRSLDEWPLSVTVAVPRSAVWDPERSWSLVAVGDILLDRGVARQVKILGKGVDFPYDGGTAEITGYRCCSGFGHRVPVYRRTGEDGAMRRLISRADLALANLESPVDDEFRYHVTGVTFSGDPALLDGVAKAGFDFASLGNNHIGDAGPDGILETMRELEKRGIEHSGAGDGLDEARRPAVLEAAGVRVAVFGCDAVARYYWTSGEGVGSRRCDTGALVRDIRRAKRSADVVIVYPHWGVEYRATPTATQRAQAREWVAAGADLVIGNHAHWAGALEEVEGRLVFYALGNFVFDQMWSEQTMEGLVLELTFHGKQVVQATLHPTLIIDQAQPNFMDPAGDGRPVLEQVRRASTGLVRF